MRTDEALRLFDSLDEVDTGSMLGAWSGGGFPTGHPLDGALEAFGWRGKRFDSEEQVHPLLFGSAGRTSRFVRRGRGEACRWSSAGRR